MGKKRNYSKMSSNVRCCVFDDAYERKLAKMYKVSLFEKNNDEVKKKAEELAPLYYSDDLTCEEFMAVVGANHPDLIDNIVFVKFMELNYRQLHIKSVQAQNKKDELMKKLVLCYKRHYGNK